MLPKQKIQQNKNINEIVTTYIMYYSSLTFYESHEIKAVVREWGSSSWIEEEPIIIYSYIFDLVVTINPTTGVSIFTILDKLRPRIIVYHMTSYY